MGRQAMWQPERVTVGDIVDGEKIIALYGPNMDLEKRVKNDYRTFCMMNRLTREEGYSPWIGQMKRSGLSAGTMKNYIFFATQGDRSTQAYKARKAMECFQADAPTKHAADIDVNEANSLIRDAIKKEPASAVPLWMLLATGQRRIDIKRLHADSVKMQLSRKKLTVRFLWTKGIRRIQHRREVELPLSDITPPPKNLEKLVIKEKDPFPCTVGGLNAAIKRLGYNATTGTFRRLFSRRMDAYCKKTGIDKKDLMLHRSADMDKAFYSLK